MATKTDVIDPNIQQIYRMVLGEGWLIEEVTDKYGTVGKTFKLYSPNEHTSWRIWLLPSDWWR